MICKKCAHENYCDMAQFGGHVPPITACPKFKEKSQTNADRIRAMSDEELAEIFADNFCGYCHIHDFCFAKGSAIDCEDVWLDWLKQSAEENSQRDEES